MTTTAATKISASMLDMRQMASRPLCTNWHKIKSGMKKCKYPRTEGSRGPRINSRPQKDPDDRPPSRRGTPSPSPRPQTCHCGKFALAISLRKASHAHHPDVDHDRRRQQRRHHDEPLTSAPHRPIRAMSAISAAARTGSTGNGSHRHRVTSSPRHGRPAAARHDHAHRQLARRLHKLRKVLARLFNSPRLIIIIIIITIDGQVQSCGDAIVPWSPVPMVCVVVNFQENRI
jgi:hypothetical protein